MINLVLRNDCLCARVRTLFLKILRYKFHEKSKQVNLTCLGHPKCSFITFLLPTLMLGLHALQRIRARVSCKHDIIFGYFGLSRNIYHNHLVKLTSFKSKEPRTVTRSTLCV